MQKKLAGFTVEERDSFTQFLDKNELIDTYRSRHPDEKDCYSFWSFMKNARAKGIGWRLDYFITSSKVNALISHSYMRKHVQGSEYVLYQSVSRLG